LENYFRVKGIKTMKKRILDPKYAKYADCPSVELLIRYREGKLISTKKDESIRRHVKSCLSCTAMLLVARNDAGEQEPIPRPRGLMKALNRVARELWEDHEKNGAFLAGAE
jgi:hypothetical protein